MTLFRKTCSTLEECEKVLQAFQDADASPASAIERLAKVRDLVDNLEKLREVADKFKKNADETDPEKKTYGASMVQKVLAFYEHFTVTSAATHELLVRTREAHMRGARHQRSPGLVNG
eukprot:1194302-Prorocentrum_minimum.AAC.5